MAEKKGVRTKMRLERHGLMHLIDSHGLGEEPEPLQKEAHLFDTKIGEVTEETGGLDEIHTGAKCFLDRGEGEKGEPVVIIVTKNGKLVGAADEADLPVFERLLGAGKTLTAKIVQISGKGSETQILIRVYLAVE